MAHNFRKAGNFYISPAGNDSWPGTADQPKATLNAAMALINASSQTIIVGTGMYTESINRSLAFYATSILADGLVKFRGNGSNGFLIQAGNNLMTMTGFVFENYASVQTASTSFNVNNCDFINCGFAGWASTGSMGSFYTFCKFIKTNLYSTSTPSNGSVANFCIFIDSDANLQQCSNSYFNTNSMFRIRGNTQNNKFIVNNIMCPINFQGTPYANLAAQQAAQPGYNAGSFNAPPKFNNVSKMDFTLQYDSPHLSAASDGTSNIGGTNYAVSSDMSLANEWTVAGGAKISSIDGVSPDLVLSGSDWVLASGKSQGTITSGAILVSANPVQLGIIDYNGQKLFNKLDAGGSATNNNVPDNVVYKPASLAGANPDRLVFEARWTDADTRPSNDGFDYEYPNGATGLIAAGQWTKFEIGALPLFDNTGKGCGEPDFSSTVTFLPNCTYIQIRITLTNLYTF